MTHVERARAFRKQIENASVHIPNEAAQDFHFLFPFWNPNDHGYLTGERVKHNDLLWKCITNHTSQASWTPVAAPSLWVRIDDPGEAWPDWVQPLGSQDAYAKGYKVSHKGDHWISAFDSNVWEPGVYGWDKQ